MCELLPTRRCSWCKLRNEDNFNGSYSLLTVSTPVTSKTLREVSLELKHWSSPEFTSRDVKISALQWSFGSLRLEFQKWNSSERSWRHFGDVSISEELGIIGLESYFTISSKHRLFTVLVSIDRLYTGGRNVSWTRFLRTADFRVMP